MSNILDDVLDTNVKNALVNLTQEIEASNGSPDRHSTKFEIIIEIQDTPINLPDQSLLGSSEAFQMQPRSALALDNIGTLVDCDLLSQKEICQRQGKTPVVIISGGKKTVVCC